MNSLARSLHAGRRPSLEGLRPLQRFLSSHSEGFKDEDLGNSPGWWAATLATYCPSRLGELAQKTITKHGEQVDENRCRFERCFKWHFAD